MPESCGTTRGAAHFSAIMGPAAAGRRNRRILKLKRAYLRESRVARASDIDVLILFGFLRIYVTAEFVLFFCGNLYVSILRIIFLFCKDDSRGSIWKISWDMMEK